MWGQAIGDPIGEGDIRIIPTHVGTRPDQTVYCTPEKDHPHACGDKD